ncbi:MAG TPA: bifunctional adenosylcobinamide kinase/adenosylcobinamide-phosphate guanylyltransferase [Geminicoccus sp.]|jgi:adenosylcobinamide kinase/adenosylcobinamide-phosphate guanylyltransferase|uniref:bifunctional adenosylcobinamide kinase/adenosylcobinamide-phosphate guanylyltransferase n=1 Tax=Geminicoccus sp. TaxID=2024832 RepID=UPI002E31162B|nr:bifunctional adenosylcobinamide kinase/adenosylcobinamide-phosphate guanylyltransferase [Geminicoccus sp.]HEX2527633.1 bifunctional adenosylcobinamide kinase/adenosylcobinamide-phosphate guanylyltransferase [Geminicoccus sp.]
MTNGARSQVTLVLGGARSGKSRHAESVCLRTGLEPVYLATSQVFDAEMASRVARHRADRDPRWTTVEEPLALAASLRLHAAPGRIVLVECLTLWVTNLMVAELDVAAASAELVATLTDLAGPVVLVSNEVGQGVVPANAMARTFVDHAGRLHQDVAAIATTVTLVVAGLALQLKGHR